MRGSNERIAYAAVAAASLGIGCAIAVATGVAAQVIPGALQGRFVSAVMSVPWMLPVIYLLVSQRPEWRRPVVLGPRAGDAWFLALGLATATFAFWPELREIAQPGIIGTARSRFTGTALAGACLLLRAFQLWRHQSVTAIRPAVEESPSR